MIAKEYELCLRALVALVCVLLASGCRNQIPTALSEITPEPTSSPLPDFDLCPLPCWAGIEPGVTTANEARRILVNRYGSEDITAEEDSISWTSNHADISRSGRVGLRDGIVVFIRVEFAESAITIADLISTAGNPDLVSVGSWRLSEGICGPVELDYYFSGTIATFGIAPEGEFVGVDPSQSVTRVAISFQSSSGLIATPVPFDSYYVEWAGYQDYCIVPEQ